MARIYVLATLATLMCAQPALAAGHCGPGEPATKAGLLLAESRWIAALESKDGDALACRLAPEFVDTNWRGRAVGRARLLAALPTRDPMRLHLDQMTAQLFGTVGIVHGRNTVTTERGEAAGAVRFTDVFVRSDGRWRAVSAQETPVASEPSS